MQCIVCYNDFDTLYCKQKCRKCYNHEEYIRNDEVIKLCHYTNYQPLWAKDNLKKGAKI